MANANDFPCLSIISEFKHLHWQVKARSILSNMVQNGLLTDESVVNNMSVAGGFSVVYPDGSIGSSLYNHIFFIITSAEKGCMAFADDLYKFVSHFGTVLSETDYGNGKSCLVRTICEQYISQKYRDYSPILHLVLASVPAKVRGSVVVILDALVEQQILGNQFTLVEGSDVVIWAKPSRLGSSLTKLVKYLTTKLRVYKNAPADIREFFDVLNGADVDTNFVPDNLLALLQNGGLTTNAPADSPLRRKMFLCRACYAVNDATSCRLPLYYRKVRARKTKFIYKEISPRPLKMSRLDTEEPTRSQIRDPVPLPDTAASVLVNENIAEQC